MGVEPLVGDVMTCGLSGGAGDVPGFAGSDGCSDEPDLAPSLEPSAAAPGAGSTTATGVGAGEGGGGVSFGAAAAAAFARAAAMRSACLWSMLRRMLIRWSSSLIFFTKSLISPGL